MRSAAIFAIVQSSLVSHALADCSTACAAFPATGVKYSGRCTVDAATTNLGAENLACLVCKYNLDNTDTKDAEGVLRALCVDAYAANEFEFSKISGRGDQFDNEHYAGGGEWNYEIETGTGEDSLEVDAARVDEVYYYEAQRKVIQFPDYLKSVNPFTNAEADPNGHGLYSDPTKLGEARANGAVDKFFPDLDGCDINAAYCCFAQDRQANDNNGNCATPYEYNCVDKDPADNANICYVDHKRSTKVNHVSGGFSIFGDLKTGAENIEGPIHCHGLVWGDDELDADNVYKGNLHFYVSMYDHMTQRGYVRNIPGAPMCACAENMPVVTRADCTQIAAAEDTTFTYDATTGVAASVYITDLNFNACQGVNANNNLEERAKQLEEDGKLSSEKRAALQQVLVGSGAGKCNAAIESFLGENGIQRTA